MGMQTAACGLLLVGIFGLCTAQWRNYNLQDEFGPNVFTPELECRPYMTGYRSPNLKFGIVQTHIYPGDPVPTIIIDYFDGVNEVPVYFDDKSGELGKLLSKCYLGNSSNHVHTARYIVAHPIAEREIIGLCHRVSALTIFRFKFDEAGKIVEYNAATTAQDGTEEDRYARKPELGFILEKFDGRNASPRSSNSIEMNAPCFTVTLDIAAQKAILNFTCSRAKAKWDIQLTEEDWAKRRITTINGSASLASVKESGEKYGLIYDFWQAGCLQINMRPHWLENKVGGEKSQNYHFILKRPYSSVQFQFCFFRPAMQEFRKQQGLQIAVWGSEAKEFCEEGPGAFEPIDEPKSVADRACQTHVFPSGGKFRIYAYEGSNSPRQDERNLPQLAIYSGDESGPMYRGDPADWKTKCATSDTMEDTAVAHFGLRVIDYDTVVAFCQDNYGEVPAQTGYVFLLKYEGGENITVIDEKQLDLPHPMTKVPLFMDSRAMIHIHHPDKDIDSVLFLQLAPCIHFEVKDGAIGDITSKKTVCDSNDFQSYQEYIPDEKETTLNDKCLRKSCYMFNGELKSGGAFDWQIYHGLELSKQRAQEPVTAAFDCIESREVLAKTSDDRLIRVFEFVDTSYNGQGDDPNTPCFSMNDWSHHAQLIYEKNPITDKLCKGDGFKLSAEPNNGVQQEPTTVAAEVVKETLAPQPQEAAPTLLPTANCTEIFMATWTAVIYAAAAAIICLSFLFLMIGLGSLGRYRYNEHKKLQREKRDEETEASQMTQASQMSQFSQADTSTINSKEPLSTAPLLSTLSSTDDKNLFSSVGQLQKAKK